MTEPAPNARVTRTDRIVAVASTLLSLLLVDDQLALVWGARTHEVAHLLELPPLAVWIPALVVVLGAALVAALGPRLGREQLVRVPVLVLVLVAFIDGPVLPEVRPDSMNLDSVGAVNVFADFVNDLTESQGQLPATEATLGPAVKQMGRPPYLVHGARPEAWTVQVRAGCTGPATSAQGVAPGVLIYCLSGDAQRAWITGVGLTSTRFGAPEILSYRGKPVVAIANAPAPQPQP